MPKIVAMESRTDPDVVPSRHETRIGENVVKKNKGCEASQSRLGTEEEAEERKLQRVAREDRGWCG